MQKPGSILKDNTGAAIVEFTLIFPMLLILSFAIVEFGLFFWQYNAAEKATQVGVRFAATRTSIHTAWTSDCGQVAIGTATAGTNCRDVPGSDTWSVTCSGAALAATCDAATMGQLVTQMQTIFPQIALANVVVEFQGSGLGFIGRGAPVPIVSVRLQNMTYDFIAIDALLGWTGIVNMPPFRASLTGEDMAG